MELTILMPCLNEAETLAACIQKAYRLLDLPGVLIWWPLSSAARGNMDCQVTKKSPAEFDFGGRLSARLLSRPQLSFRSEAGLISAAMASASASRAASWPLARADLSVILSVMNSIFFIGAMSSRMIFPLAGAQLPFSMTATLRF